MSKWIIKKLTYPDKVVYLNFNALTGEKIVRTFYI